MKKILYIASFALLCACSGAGTADPDVPPTGGQDDTPALEAGYYVYTDKTVIEADGKDRASFTIKDQDGNIVSTDANVDSRKIWYVNVADNTRLDAKSTGLTSIVDGEFEFQGLFGSTKTKNTIKIKVQNRAKYEVFHKNVAIFKLTATWCTNCPGMTNVLNSLGEDAASHSIVLACHNDDGNYSLSFNQTGTDLAAAVALHAVPGLKGLSLPSNVYDLDVLDDVRTVAGVTDNIMQCRIDNPAGTGVKITSVRMDGNDLKVTAAVKASKAGEYDLTCAVLANNVNAGGYGSADGVYHHMVVSVNQDNFMTLRNDTKFSLNADEEFTREFVFPMGGNVSSSALADLSVAVLSLKKDKSGKVIVDNCAECAYGMTTEYVYN